MLQSPSYRNPSSLAASGLLVFLSAIYDAFALGCLPIRGELVSRYSQLVHSQYAGLTDGRRASSPVRKPQCAQRGVEGPMTEPETPITVL